MWLIDENLPVKLHFVLQELGVSAKSVSFAGLAGLDNGVLTSEAFRLGFRCILTQDRNFPRDADKALKESPLFGVVIIRLEQTPANTYLQRFRDAWNVSPIVPVPGQVIEWG